jgi:elongation factor P
MVKIDVSGAKRGVVLDIEGVLYRVSDTGHTHTGRGGATYTLKAKNVVSGANNTFTYKSGTMLESADLNTMNATYLYNNGADYSFMINDTGEIVDIPEDDLGDSVNYLKDNLDLFVQVYNEKIIWIVLPKVITFKITSTLPADRGNRANAGTKPATIETGLEIQVPAHKSEGDEVSVNTETGAVS